MQIRIFIRFNNSFNNDKFTTIITRLFRRKKLNLLLISSNIIPIRNFSRKICYSAFVVLSTFSACAELFKGSRILVQYQAEGSVHLTWKYSPNKPNFSEKYVFEYDWERSLKNVYYFESNQMFCK